MFRAQLVRPSDFLWTGGRDLDVGVPCSLLPGGTPGGLRAGLTRPAISECARSGGASRRAAGGWGTCRMQKGRTPDEDGLRLGPGRADDLHVGRGQLDRPQGAPFGMQCAAIMQAPTPDPPRRRLAVRGSRRVSQSSLQTSRPPFCPYPTESHRGIYALGAGRRSSGDGAVEPRLCSRPVREHTDIGGGRARRAGCRGHTGSRYEQRFSVRWTGVPGNERMGSRGRRQ